MKITENLFLYPEKGMLDCNTYVIKDDITVLIDPGLEQHIQGLARDMRNDGIDPKDIDIITNTHLHMDHCWANRAFKDLSGAKIALHQIHKKHFNLNMKELPKILGPLFGGRMEPPEFEEDSLLDDKLNTGNMEFELLHAPGHSPDSMCFYCRDEGLLICGDVVFAQSTGRVDFPGGNAEEIKCSIEGLALLDIEYLLPGHMGFVKGRDSVKGNFEFIRQYIFPLL
jgi:glyoxylase-like metal-dependent hydrolase (beta-lactamase superfamily II)